MAISEIESLLDIKYSVKDVCNWRGKLFLFAMNWIFRPLEKAIKKGVPFTEAILKFIEDLGINTNSSYSSKFENLLKNKDFDNYSFIFYGDHNLGIEPVVALAGFPGKIKQAMIGYEKLNSDNRGLKFIGSDTLVLFTPVFMKNIFPVVLRDSADQYDYLKSDFIEKRREKRTILSEKAICNSADYISNKGRNFFIFPQGFKNSVEWKSGILRILHLMKKNHSDRLRHTFLIPIKYQPSEKDIVSLFITNYFQKKFHSQVISHKVFFGDPVCAGDFMKNWNLEEKDFDNLKLQMKLKTKELQDNYYKWSDSVN